jgi:hypothetical protein
MGIFASQFLVPFSDPEYRLKGHMAQGSVRYVAFAFYEYNSKIMNDKDIINCAEQVNLPSIKEFRRWSK